MIFTQQGTHVLHRVLVPLIMSRMRFKLPTYSKSFGNLSEGDYPEDLARLLSFAENG